MLLRSFALLLPRRRCRVRLGAGLLRRYSVEANNEQSKWPWIGIAWVSLLGGATFFTGKFALEAYHKLPKAGKVRVN
jgi:hypothetical protein